MVIRSKSVVFLWALGFLMGCATVITEPVLDATRELVAARGVQRIHWRTGGEEDAKVDELIRLILSKELTSDDAVQVAILNNRNLQSTYESLRIAQADLIRAGLLNNPFFDAEVRFAQGGAGTGLELALVQDFIDILYIPLRKNIASSGVEAAKLTVGGKILELAAEVKKAFYSLQAAQQALDMRRQVVKATEASYDLSKRLHAAKNITDLDLANERALFEQSKLDLRQAELQVLRGREGLNDLMGLWGGQTNWQIKSKLPSPSESEVALKGLERKAVERSLDLSILRQQIEQASLSLGLARPLSLFPEGEFGVTSEREPEGEWAVGPAFSIPLPILNQGQPAVASATAELRSLTERYMAQAVTLRARVRTAHAALVAARDQADYYSKVLLPLRQRIVQESQLQYNAMQISPAQLLLAKQQQIEAANEYIQSLLTYWTLRTELELLLNGRMTAVSETAEARRATGANQSAQGDH